MPIFKNRAIFLKIQFKPLLLTVLTNASNSQKELIQNELESLENFSPAKIVLVQVQTDDHHLVKYNLLDSNNKIRFSWWYDPQSGFLVKEAVFDTNGNLISFKIYFNLHIDDNYVNDARMEAGQKFEKWIKFWHDKNRLNFNSIDLIQGLIEDSHDFPH